MSCVCLTKNFWAENWKRATNFKLITLVPAQSSFITNNPQKLQDEFFSCSGHTITRHDCQSNAEITFPSFSSDLVSYSGNKQLKKGRKNKTKQNKNGTGKVKERASEKTRISNLSEMMTHLVVSYQIQ